MRVLSIALVWALFPVVLFAQPVVPPVAASSKTVPVATDAPVRDLDAVVVAGTQPGPGMWKVSKGDHVLWILGTVSPLPGGIEWKADEVREALEQADEVLDSPGIVVGADIGLFRGLLLMPSAMKAMRNPGDKTLQEILPAETYARWVGLKQRYMGRDSGIEKKRPWIAADELYGKAVKRTGLGGGVVSPLIDEVLKKRKMKRTPAALKITIDDPKAIIAEFRKEQVPKQELACMDQRLDMIERDLPRMVERANAWATGDLEALRSMPMTDPESCWSAWTETEAVRKRGLTDIDTRIRAKWLEVAGAALEKNRVTFATLPMSDLLKPNGYLSYLQAKGYEVEAPM